MTLLLSLFQRLDTKSKDISKIAGDITQAVSLSQGMERKKVIQHIRGMYKAELSASRHWQELVQQLTHDRWVFSSWGKWERLDAWHALLILLRGIWNGDDIKIRLTFTNHLIVRLVKDLIFFFTLSFKISSQVVFLSPLDSFFSSEIDFAVPSTM